MNHAARGMEAAWSGLVVNVLLMVVKLVAGVAGHSYALIADSIESSMDIFSSLIVWGGLRITTRPADEDYPYGYGKAESLAAVAVSLMLLGAAIGITVAAAGQVMTPHRLPSAFTLAVIPIVILVKESLYRRVLAVGRETGSTAVQADAWHHRSDAITSAAAFIGIAIARWGGSGWEAADDYAAMVAALTIAANALILIRPAIHDLMDRMPGGPAVDRIASAARGVVGVLGIEKLRVRKFGMEYFVDIHVKAEPEVPLSEAHRISGRVKAAIRSALPEVSGVLIHMEPYEPPSDPIPERPDFPGRRNNASDPAYLPEAK